MADPPRDKDGNIIPYDDPNIVDADGLLRYIDPDNHLAPDKNSGGWRISSGAFSESSHPGGGMSVDLEHPLIAATGSNVTRLPTPDFGLVRLVAGEMRELGCNVGSTPKEDNPYHCDVWGINKKSKKREICAKARIITKPKGM